MATAARSRPLVGKYAFKVLVDGVNQAKFQKASGLGMTLNIGEYREGGALAPMKEVTTATFSNITLEHGVWENLELKEWVEDCINMMVYSPEGAGIASPAHLRNLMIEQLRRDRSPLRVVNCYNCQPAAYNPGEFDNTSTEVQVETLEIAMEYFVID